MPRNPRVQFSDREARYRNRALRESDNPHPPEPEPVVDHQEEEERNSENGRDSAIQENEEVSSQNEVPQHSGSESEEDSAPNPSRSRKHYPEITPELLESMGFMRRQERPQNSNLVVRPNITVTAQLPLGKPYSGGSDLKQYEKAFRTISSHNGWPDKVSVVNLVGNLKRIRRLRCQT